MPVNTSTKANSLETIRGTVSGSITMTTPRPPKSGLQKWKGVPLSEWGTTSYSHLHLIRK